MVSHAAVAARMRARLLARLKEVEGAAPAIEPAPAVESGQRRVAPSEAGM
jgi:hypothetical protein